MSNRELADPLEVVARALTRAEKGNEDFADLYPQDGSSGYYCYWEDKELWYYEGINFAGRRVAEGVDVMMLKCFILDKKLTLLPPD